MKTVRNEVKFSPPSRAQLHRKFNLFILSQSLRFTRHGNRVDMWQSESHPHVRALLPPLLDGQLSIPYCWAHCIIIDSC